MTPKPPDITFPPTELAYQSTVDPAGGVADITTVPAFILLPLLPVGADGEVAGLHDIKTGQVTFFEEERSVPA